jgi:hypothetical protein
VKSKESVEDNCEPNIFDCIRLYMAGLSVLNLLASALFALTSQYEKGYHTPLRLNGNAQENISAKETAPEESTRVQGSHENPRGTSRIEVEAAHRPSSIDGIGGASGGSLPVAWR